MGTSTDAILAYGYDLGGEDAGWKVRNVEAWKYDDDAVIDDMTRRLAVDRGMLIEPDGYIDTDEVKKRTGVDFVMYQHIDFPAYVLATTYHEVHRGHSLRIETLDVPEGSDEKLRAAVEAIGIEPTEGPGWYLVSYWG